MPNICLPLEEKIEGMRGRSVQLPTKQRFIAAESSWTDLFSSEKQNIYS